MKQLINETEYRRGRQIAYNEAHGIVPQSVSRGRKDIFQDALGDRTKAYESFDSQPTLAAEDAAEYMSSDDLKDKIAGIRKLMEAAAKELNFVEAARLRDEMFAFQALLKERR